MIQVTIWNEFVQEQLGSKSFPFLSDWQCSPEDWERIRENTRRIRTIHPEGIHQTLKALVEEDADIQVRHIATLEMEQCGLTEEVLRNTDVLIWWSHIAQGEVPDEIAARVAAHVQRGMGLIVLHSGHMCKPMQRLLGTSCTLRWREGDREKLWCVNPSHPIAAGVPQWVELAQEEMYGEYFDIPAPDELVFLGSFGGGEVFRSGCVWNRGHGKFFYFQPGHETCPSYLNQHIRTILRNAVHYVARPGYRTAPLECIAEPASSWQTRP